jgi:hypothetical protein
MAVTHLVVELHILDIESGIWCPVCLVPSMVEVTWAGADPDSLKVRVRGVSTFCDGCGFDLLEEP